MMSSLPKLISKHYNATDIMTVWGLNEDRQIHHEAEWSPELYQDLNGKSNFSKNTR